MASESGIERRATWWNGSVARYGEVAGEARMPFFLSDLLLFVCLAGWVTGMVIAIASLLS